MAQLVSRFALYLISSLLMLIPAGWAASYGLSFDGSTLTADLPVALSAAISAGAAGLGISITIFAVWGSGGIPGLCRTIIYSLTPALTAAAASVTGWGVTISDGIVSVHIPTLISMLFAGGSISAGILARWGVR